MKVLYERIRIRCYVCNMPFEARYGMAFHDDHGTTPCPYCHTEQSVPYGCAEVAVEGRIDPRWEWHPDSQKTGSWFDRDASQGCQRPRPKGRSLQVPAWEQIPRAAG